MAVVLHAAAPALKQEVTEMGEAKRRKLLDAAWGTVPRESPSFDESVGSADQSRPLDGVLLERFLRALIDADLNPAATYRVMRTLAGRDPG